jgi:DNA-binding NarL/FixJ family response regulator
VDNRVFLSAAVTSRLVIQATRGASGAGRTAVALLSDRELQIFELIGTGLATRKIAERLHLSPKTVDTHRQRIREKLCIEDAASLAHYATQWVIEAQRAALAENSASSVDQTAHPTH